MSWRFAELVAVHDETPTARTLTLRVPDWPGARAGQHIDVRLTAADGYQASRSYSLSSAAGSPTAEISVEYMPDGEVSPYLVRQFAVGDLIEVLGPLGGWFVWRPEQPEPVRLIGGGSGIAPLVSMLRSHAASGSTAPVHLLYSVRSPEFVYFADELAALAAAQVTIRYTRRAPAGWTGPVGRLDTATIADWAAASAPDGGPTTTYICGPTPFVELAAAAVVATGADPLTVRTERFGG